jgi:hypothetical protein
MLIPPDTRTPRQKRLYTFLYDIYKPEVLTAVEGDIEAPDAGVNIGEPAYHNVYGFYKGTPELDVAELAGRMKELNLFTLDEHHFTADQPLADQWILHLIGSDPGKPPHPYIGRVWVVRDNPQMVASQGHRRTNYIMAYAVLSNVPGLSTLISNIS